ncbi:MAG: hypothetical protein H7X95_03600 [Deltaproteobacteria bacterium]|nr:hypothetical protein [Deltaproteobacteria bacterium]
MANEDVMRSKSTAGGAARLAAAVGAGVVALFVFPAGVAGKTIKYGGIHPLAPHAGDFCYIDMVHVHAQAPSDMRPYRVLPDGAHLFVGDEAALGYSGAKHAYFGPHPVSMPGPAASAAPLYCYLRGPHFHASAPSPAASFVVKNDVAWFTGTFPAEFERDRFNVWVNDVRAIVGYQPPPVDIGAAPSGYHVPGTVDVPAPRVLVPEPPPANEKGTRGSTKNVKTKAAQTKSATPKGQGAP